MIDNIITQEVTNEIVQELLSKTSDDLVEILEREDIVLKDYSSTEIANKYIAKIESSVQSFLDTIRKQLLNENLTKQQKDIEKSFKAAIKNIDYWTYRWTDLQSIISYAEAEGVPFPEELVKKKLIIPETLKYLGYNFKTINQTDIYQFLLDNPNLQRRYTFDLEDLDEICHLDKTIYLHNTSLNEFFESCLENY